ncbi:MAG: hypothetical protein ABR976_21025 [Terracidiphilus sp.]|jgi:hypothetical protein
MRVNTIFLPLLLASGLACAKAQMTEELAGLPPGQVSDGVYSNDALGIRLHVPAGWSISTDLSNTPTLDIHPDGLANRCTRILLREDAPTGKDGFPSWGIFFAIDAHCLSLGSFPKSIKDRDGIMRLMHLLVDSFKHSPFFPQSGVDWGASPPAGKHVSMIVNLTGYGRVVGPGGEATGPRLNTIFCVTEHKGHWVGWANVSDDTAKEQLQKEANVEFRVD